MADLIRLEISSSSSSISPIVIHRISREFRTLHDRLIARVINRTRVRTRSLFAFSSKIFPQLSKYPVFKRFFLTFFGMTRGKGKNVKRFREIRFNRKRISLATNFIILSCAERSFDRNRAISIGISFVDNVSQHFLRYVHRFIVAKS